jgi:hypothetical protein
MPNTLDNPKKTKTGWRRLAGTLHDLVATLRRALDPGTEETQIEASSTIFRFFRSRHVADLRIIFMLAMLFAAILVVTSPFMVWFAMNVSEDSTQLEWIKFLLSYIGAPLTACAVIVSWVYLSASARLGIVDLFACEISTLCRVGTVVDVAARYANQHRTIVNGSGTGGRGQDRAPTNFVSQENYFPVFESNSKDLQVLEAQVVIDITAFYTYMKATRDTMRKLSAVMESPSNDFQHAERDATLETLMKMLFLGFESGRNAVQKLVEYEPTKTDVTIIILITELKCYSFLLEHEACTSEGLYKRIKLREARYKEIIDEISLKVALGLERLKKNPEPYSEWVRASLALPTLKARYNEALAAGRRENSGSAHKATSSTTSPSSSLETFEHV